MKRPAVVIGSVLLLAACNKAAHNPNVTTDEAKAQKIVQTCAAHANFLTKPGRDSFYTCLAQGRDKAAVQACAQKQFAADGVLTKTARAKFENDLAGCILK